MKNILLLTLTLFCSSLLFTSCGDKTSDRKKEAREQLEINHPSTTIPNTSPTPPVTPTAEPAQNAAGVWHYTCSNGCEMGMDMLHAL